MENASKALIIAGGVLIGLLTISLFYTMFSNISTFVDDTSVDYREKELKAFNQEFEAYNKKLMYGSDLISVINKAIDNNISNKVTAGDNSGYSVDVVIRFKNDLEQRNVKYKKNNSGVGYEKISSLSQTVLRSDRDYSLKNDQEVILAYIIDKLTVNGTESTYTAGCDEYQIKYYPVEEFRRKIFRCVSNEITYNTKTGRIEKMVFEEK